MTKTIIAAVLALTATNVQAESSSPTIVGTDSKGGNILLIKDTIEVESTKGGKLVAFNLMSVDTTNSRQAIALRYSVHCKSGNAKRVASGTYDLETGNVLGTTQTIVDASDYEEGSAIHNAADIVCAYALAGGSTTLQTEKKHYHPRNLGESRAQEYASEPDYQ